MRRALVFLAAAAATATAAALAAGPPPRGEQVGRSLQGRELRLVRVGPSDAATRVLVVGCIHGSEPAGMEVTRALRRPDPPPGVELLVLDAVNPDGCARGTRGNARGVDLNRNFPWRWRRQGGLFASGARPASEPETRAAMALAERERPAVTIWFHQHMNLVDRTRGADPAIVRRYATVARMRRHRIGPLPGTASRWQNHRFSRASAFVVELPAGRLDAGAVRRHVAAVLAVARLAAARDVSVSCCARAGA